LTRRREHDSGFDHAETVDAYPRLSNADLDRIDTQRRQRRQHRALRAAAIPAGAAVLLAAVGVVGWRVSIYDSAHQAASTSHPRVVAPAAVHHPAATPAASPAAQPAASPSCLDACGQTEPVVFTAGNYSGTDPSMIDFSADGGNIAGDLTWGPWPSGPNGNVPVDATVTGTGTVYIQGCVPDCADGSETPEPVTIVLSDPIPGDPVLWGQMTETIQGQNMATMGGEGTDGHYTYPSAWAIGAN
jgi:hypothetical protein